MMVNVVFKLRMWEHERTTNTNTNRNRVDVRGAVDITNAILIGPAKLIIPHHHHSRAVVTTPKLIYPHLRRPCAVIAVDGVIAVHTRLPTLIIPRHHHQQNANRVNVIVMVVRWLDVAANSNSHIERKSSNLKNDKGSFLVKSGSIQKRGGHNLAGDDLGKHQKTRVTDRNPSANNRNVPPCLFAYLHICFAKKTCLRWMWELFQVGLEPQQPQNGVISSPAVTQDISQLSKSGHTSAMSMAW
jgi:hypothetical protein